MIGLNMEECTGCGACVQKCPQKCIMWEHKELGFHYPVVDKEACTNCGLCERVCPIENELNNTDNQKAFAVVHKEKATVKNSTSGGAFSALAHYVLNKHGIVYGCIMDDKFNVIHIRTDNDDDLKKMQGSKYVQSDVKETYLLAEKDLKQGLWVLYTGTPCQIAGLRKYLIKEYERLITVDIVCHGVGSQGYFSKFLENVKLRYGDIIELKFRSKEYVGWSCGSGVVIKKNSRKMRPFYHYNNYYYYYFLKGYIFRKSCYSCKYANIVRPGDFTLGDFWGIEALNLPIDTSNGCSLVIVNNKKARDILDSIKEFQKVEVSLEQAVSGNKQLKYPSKLPALREVLIEEYNTLEAVEIQKKFLQNNYGEIIKGRLKSMVPYQVKRMIRKRRK